MADRKREWRGNDMIVAQENDGSFVFDPERHSARLSERDAEQLARMMLRLIQERKDAEA